MNSKSSDRGPRCAAVFCGVLLLLFCYGSCSTDARHGDFSGSDGDSDTDSDSDSDQQGCDGVDFLFVVDSSISMYDEQQNLINSFPGFISAITDTLDLNDFHIMVVDSDSIYLATFGIVCHACTEEGCCTDWCTPIIYYYECSETGAAPYYMCQEWLSGDPQSPNCDNLLGAGHTGSNENTVCSIEGGNRYLLGGQPDLNETFACIANVGIDGNGIERVMEAMVNSVGPWTEQGACNDGFIRESAILVVTFVTDEDEDCAEVGEVCSEGTPETWKQALVDAKGGNQDAIVMLGVFGDNDLSDGICQPQDPLDGSGAQAAPLLREFTDSFGDHGHFCSVCLPDYSECFLEAVSTIDMTCEEFDVE